MVKQVLARKMSGAQGARFRFLCCVLALLPVLTACSDDTQSNVVVEAPRPVKVVVVGADKALRMLAYSGSVKARYEANLSFRVTGKLVARKVDVGQHVLPGDLLARLDETDFELGVQRAQADLDAATRQVETLATAKFRAEQLFERNAASKSDLDQRLLSYDQAVSTKKSAESALDQAKNQVSYTKLNSNVAGIITQVSADAGQVVGAGSPVVTVAVDGEKEVLIGVPETDINQFKVGKQVTARFWSDESLRLPGTVREVAGSADPLSRTFSVRVKVPDDQRVLLGMTATIEAPASEEKGAFDLPLSSLSKVEGKDVVYAVDPASMTIEVRNVQLGRFSQTGVLVASGLKKGDMVVVAGVQFMKQGLKIAILPPSEDQSAESQAVETKSSK